jgi:hypothetical protein
MLFSSGIRRCAHPAQTLTAFGALPFSAVAATQAIEQLSVKMQTLTFAHEDRVLQQSMFVS